MHFVHIANMFQIMNDHVLCTSNEKENTLDSLRTKK